MDQEINIKNGRHRSLKKSARIVKIVPRVDLTPMVDLGFLLITFFMLTTELTAEKAMEWTKRIDTKQDQISDCQVLNILVDTLDNLYVYPGLNINHMERYVCKGEQSIRQKLINESRRIKMECPAYKDGKAKDMFCLVKLLPGSRYKTMIDVLDALDVLKITTYSIQEPAAEELAELKIERENLVASK